MGYSDVFWTNDCTIKIFVELKAKEEQMNYNIDNKELLMRAIEEYDILTKAQRKVLAIIVSFEHGIKTKAIANIIGVTAAAIYEHLETLLNDNFIINISKKNSPGIFIANNNKMLEITKFFTVKQNYEKN